MTGLIRAELFKARNTRSIWALGLIGVLFCVAWAIVDVLVFHDSIENAYGMAQQGYLLALILGIVVASGEYRHQTITWALLVTPRRGRVITAKLAACGVIGLVLGIAAAVVTAAVTATLLAFENRADFTPGVALVLLGSILGTALWCVFGAALGVLIRNMVAAITIAFVWFFYAEWFLVMLLPAVGRWTPTGVAKAVSGWSRAAMPVEGDLLPVWAAGLVFLGYALVAASAARLISIRRDVT